MENSREKKIESIRIVWAILGAKNSGKEAHETAELLYLGESTVRRIYNLLDKDMIDLEARVDDE